MGNIVKIPFGEKETRDQHKNRLLDELASISAGCGLSKNQEQELRHKKDRARLDAKGRL